MWFLWIPIRKQRGPSRVLPDPSGEDESRGSRAGLRVDHIVLNLEVGPVASEPRQERKNKRDGGEDGPTPTEPYRVSLQTHTSFRNSLFCDMKLDGVLSYPGSSLLDSL